MELLLILTYAAICVAIFKRQPLPISVAEVENRRGTYLAAQGAMQSRSGSSGALHALLAPLRYYQNAPSQMVSGQSIGGVDVVLTVSLPEAPLGCEIYSPYPSLSVRVDTQRLLQRLAISALRLDRYASQLQATVCKTLTS